MTVGAAAGLESVQHGARDDAGIRSAAGYVAVGTAGLESVKGGASDDAGVKSAAG